MTTEATLPKPPHFLDDMPAWLDLSTWHAFQLEGVSTEAVAAAAFDDPKDKAFTLLRLKAIEARQQWEASHPRRPFPGVYLSPEQAG